MGLIFQTVIRAQKNSHMTLLRATADLDAAGDNTVSDDNVSVWCLDDLT